MTRHRRGWGTRRPVVVAGGELFRFATPGAPTPEERRAYAAAILAARTPPPLSPAQQERRDADLRQRRELFPQAYLGDRSRA